ncbi:MAG TPA: glycoside hydrolase family 18 protein [Thermoanaerobaculia bacterium]|jgi:chitinase|nr:glycoside hydrolase family 18 protein [Thermoanaerobaculia bacterium]
MVRRALLLFLFLLAPLASAATRLIAYVDKDTDIPRMSAEKLTHVNYAFASIDDDGDVVLQTVDLQRLRQLRELRTRNANLKILLSIGGARARHFRESAATAASRRRFAESAAALVRGNALDGVDVDWEYPERREERRNFPLLLAELRRVLGPRRLLTIASSGGESLDTNMIGELHPYLDWINLMGYDMAGAWTPRTGHSSALYWNPAAGDDGPSVYAFVKQYLAAGVPPAKLVLGVPFDAHVFTGVRRQRHGFNQPYEEVGRSIPWYQIGALKGFVRYWDDVAAVPYLWNERTATFISYDDPQSLHEKVRFVRKERLGGMMYWLQRHDPDEQLLDVLVRRLRESERTATAP